MTMEVVTAKVKSGYVFELSCVVSDLLSRLIQVRFREEPANPCEV
jgi:hypothetical protein